MAKDHPERLRSIQAQLAATHDLNPNRPVTVARRGERIAAGVADTALVSPDAAADPTAMDAMDALDAAGVRLVELAGQVGPDQWSDPTPCTEWTVRTLVGHLIAGT
jgi:Mycothiol maleylpyruvate isomerase N-terminal domain